MIKLWGHKNPGISPTGGASLLYSLLKTFFDSSPHAIFNTYMTAPFNLEVQFWPYYWLIYPRLICGVQVPGDTSRWCNILLFTSSQRYDDFSSYALFAENMIQQVDAGWCWPQYLVVYPSYDRWWRYKQWQREVEVRYWLQRLRIPKLQNGSRPKMEREMIIRINTFYPTTDSKRRVNVKKVRCDVIIIHPRKKRRL